MAAGGGRVSYPLVKAAAMTLLGRVTGIPAAGNLGHYPTTVHGARALTTVLDRFERSHSAQQTIMRYFLTSTLWVKWTDNAAAEAELEGFINLIPVEVDDDPSLGHTCNIAIIESGNTTFRTVGGTLFRACDFNWNILEKKPRGQI